MKNLHEGLGILLKYYPEGSTVDTDRDWLWCGDNAAATREKMSPMDRLYLHDFGWFVDEEVDAWCHAT